MARKSIMPVKWGVELIKWLGVKGLCETMTIEELAIKTKKACMYISGEIDTILADLKAYTKTADDRMGDIEGRADSLIDILSGTVDEVERIRGVVESEAEALEKRENALEGVLSDIRKRLQELEEKEPHAG